MSINITVRKDLPLGIWLGMGGALIAVAALLIGFGLMAIYSLVHCIEDVKKMSDARKGVQS